MSDENGSNESQKIALQSHSPSWFHTSIKIFELKSFITPTPIHKLELYENSDENCFTRKLLIKSEEGDEDEDESETSADKARILKLST